MSNRLTLRLTGALLGTLLATTAVSAAEKQKMEHIDGMYVIELAGMYNFHSVVDMLQMQLFERGWEVRDIHDVDLRLRKHGHLMHNKVITASKPEYVSTASEESLRSSLVIPTSIVVYESYAEVDDSYSYRTKPGTIEIAFIDPTTKAKAVGLEGLPKIEQTTKELRDAAEATVNFFIELATVPKDREMPK